MAIRLKKHKLGDGARGVVIANPAAKTPTRPFVTEVLAWKVEDLQLLDRSYICVMEDLMGAMEHIPNPMVYDHVD